MNLSFRQMVALGSFFVMFITLSLASFLWGMQAVKASRLQHTEQMHKMTQWLSQDIDLLKAKEPEENKALTNLINQEQIKTWANDVGYRLTIIDLKGRVLADSMVGEVHWADLDNHLNRPEVTQALNSGTGSFKRFSATGMREYLYATRKIKGADGEELILRLAKPLKEVDEVKWTIFQNYIFTIIIGVILTVLFSMALSRYILAPLNLVTQTAKAIARGDLKRRVMHYPNNELAGVGRAFDSMADRLAIQMGLAEQSRDYLLAVLGAATEGVMVTNKQGKITVANQAFKQLFNIKGNIEGLTPAEAIRLPKLIEALQKAYNGETVSEVLVNIGDPPGKSIEVSLSQINPDNENSESRHQGLVGVFHDITSRQKLYQMRRDFVANVSHDLRTPLTSILAAAETLKKIPDLGDGQKFLDIIERQGQRLNVLTEGLLHLPRLESAPEELKLSEFTVSDLISSVCDRFNNVEHEVKLEVNNLAGDTKLTGDFESLAVALVNLLDNAVKYGPAGQVVTLEALTVNNQLLLKVADQGPGVPIAERERLFERFYRLERSRASQSGGAGLGLAIVKHTAKNHSGDARVSCPESGGSVFEIAIPLHKS